MKDGCRKGLGHTGNSAAGEYLESSYMPPAHGHDTEVMQRTSRDRTGIGDVSVDMSSLLANSLGIHKLLRTFKDLHLEERGPQN